MLLRLLIRQQSNRENNFTTIDHSGVHKAKRGCWQGRGLYGGIKSSSQIPLLCGILGDRRKYRAARDLILHLNRLRSAVHWHGWLWITYGHWISKRRRILGLYKEDPQLGSSRASKIFKRNSIFHRKTNPKYEAADEGRSAKAKCFAFIRPASTIKSFLQVAPHS